MMFNKYGNFYFLVLGIVMIVIYLPIRTNWKLKNILNGRQKDFSKTLFMMFHKEVDLAFPGLGIVRTKQNNISDGHENGWI